MTADNSQHQAVTIVAYLAQFALADPDTDPDTDTDTDTDTETTTDHSLGYADLPDPDRHQRHRDYLRAAHWPLTCAAKATTSLPAPSDRLMRDEWLNGAVRGRHQHDGLLGGIETTSESCAACLQHIRN